MNNPQRSLERRRVFDPLLGQFSESIGHPVRSGRLETKLTDKPRQ
jgi:hypothetical protein